MSTTKVAEAASATTATERKARPRRKAGRNGDREVARDVASSVLLGDTAASVDAVEAVEPHPDDTSPLTEEARSALAVARGYAASGPYSPLDPRLWPDISDVVTEDDTPVDNYFVEKQQRLLTEPLYTSWGTGGGRPFIAFANVGLFYRHGYPPVVPDMMLSLDIEAPEDLFVKAHRSYFLWVYGKPPDVIVEVVSDRRGGEAGRKLELYARLGVDYYVIHDPYRRLSREVLRVFQLVAGTYEHADDGRMPEIGLSIGLWQGAFEGAGATWLRWFTADGTLLLTGAEKAGAAERDADAAERRAEAAERHAEAESRRAARLAEKLRALGVDVDGEPDDEASPGAG